MPFSLTFPFSFPSDVVDPTAAAYARQLSQLLPPGRAFDTEGDSVVTKTNEALATELARVAGRCVDLIRESDPRTASETIGDWEKMLSLPDDRILTIPATLSGRQLAITQKYVNRGGQSEPFFVSLAAACGYDLAGGSLPSPTALSAVASGTGGTLNAGTYSYRVTAFNDQGETLASTAATNVIGAGTTNKNTLQWNSVPGATGYRVYGRASGIEHFMGGVSDVSTPTYSFVDDGSVTPTGAPPVANTANYPAIERFATKILRSGFRTGARCYAVAWAYVMRLNFQPPAGVVLSQAEFERVIRHVTHAHITDVFVFH